MIVPMKHLTLIAMKQDEEKLMYALQEIGAVQLIAEGDAAPDDAALSAAEALVARLKSAYDTLKPLAEKSKLGPKPEYTAEQLIGELPDGMQLYEQVDAHTRELAHIRAEADKKRALIQSLAPWEELDSPIESIRSLKGGVRYFTGTVDANAFLQLEDVPAAIETFGSGRDVALLIACQTNDAEEVQAALKVVAFTEYTFPKLTGTPRANIQRLNEELDALAAQDKAINEALTALSANTAELGRALDAASIQRDREQSKLALAATQTAFILTGWVRSDETQRVQDAVSAVTDACYIELRDPLDDEIPPSVVKNSKLVAPFEAVTNLYSKPDPRGIDATPLMAPFYFLFFGMMLSDSGYGLVLALGCWAFLKFMKPEGMTRAIAQVLCLGGISTIICGVFIGTFFGMDWNVFLGTPAGTFPLLFDPMTEPMSMLFLCFGLGLFHMLTGVCIKVVRCIKAKDWAGAIFDNFSWLMIVIGILVFALPNLVEGVPAIVSKIGIFAAIAGAAMVLVFTGRGKKPFGRALSGAGKLYDVTSYLSDMLSYARVFALGLSTGVIGQVFNTLGSMFNGAFQNGLILQAIGFLLTAVLLAALHMFSLGINTLGCFIHCARLQYVEFYGKFYDAGGKDFLPLAFRARTVRVKAQP